MKRIYYKSQEIVVDTKDILGSGGEADVIKNGKIAFKLYHDPSKERAEKLADFLQQKFKLPDNVACPLDLVYNGRKQVIGFAMLVAKKCQEVMKLSNKKFRTQERVNTNDVISVFTHMKETLNQLHDNKIFIGDFNDLNVMFNDKFQSVFIDVDSYQFGNWPCPVGTDQFIDPNLYGIDLSKKAYFSAETDWYSFAVMLFKCLLLTHPYGGTHKVHKNTFDRIKNHVTVFDKEVVYPKIALYPDSLGDDLLHWFDLIFVKDQRVDFKLELLRDLNGSFKECNSCGLYYHESRGLCPVCHKGAIQSPVDITQIVHPKQKNNDKCMVDILFITDGTILFTKIIDNKIIVVEYLQKQGTRLHIFDGTSWNVYTMWDNHIKNIKYDFYDKYLFVASDDCDLMIFELGMGKIKPLKKTTTMAYDNVPMFSCSKGFYYRLTDKVLLRGYVKNGELLEETIQTTFENQTWFSVGQKDLGLGFFRIYSDYHYFVFSSKGRYEINLPKLNGKFIEISVEYSNESVLLLRKTLYNGRTHSHMHVINDTGKIIESRFEESLNSDVLRVITGKILVGTATVVHPTDNGIVIEKQGNMVLKSETAEYVSANSDLAIYKDGMVSITDQRVLFMRLLK